MYKIVNDWIDRDYVDVQFCVQYTMMLLHEIVWIINTPKF